MEWSAAAVYRQYYLHVYPNTAQLFINDRHWAGNIKEHQIAAVNDVNVKTKEVLVTVIAAKSSGNRSTVDRQFLKKQKNEWLIDEFVSGTQPELP